MTRKPGKLRQTERQGENQVQRERSTALQKKASGKNKEVEQSTGNIEVTDKTNIKIRK